MTTTFLLEIGTEELPADFARQALSQLEERVIRDLKEARLNHGPVRAFGSPRRLGLSVATLESRQPDLEDERKGPPVAQAIQNGAPGPAAVGFAKRCGVSPSDLVEKETPKGPCLFAMVRTPGRDSGSLLTELIPNWVDALQGRRFMRWGTGTQRFSRPIRWLLALRGSDVIPVSIPGADPVVCSDRWSRGHRLLADAPLRIDSADDYPDMLAAAGVLWIGRTVPAASEKGLRANHKHPGESLTAPRRCLKSWWILSSTQRCSRAAFPIVFCSYLLK